MEGPKPISQFDPAAAFTVDDFLCGIVKIGEAQYNNVKMPRSVFDALYYSASNPNGYLSAINKAMVEAVLTGEISTHSHAETNPVFTAWRDATRNANHAFMAPSAGGAPTWRQIDYSDLANTPTIPTGFTLSSDLLSGGINTLNAYATNQAAQRRFYTTADTPTGTNRLNVGAYFYATRLYEGTNRVVTGTPWTSVGYLIGSNNLSDVANATTARSNLGLGTAATINTGTTEGTIPILGTGGKLSTSVLPELAISDTYVVTSQAAQLALTVQKGDLAVRSDLNKSYINSTGNNTGMSDWVELLSPPNAVSSVFGRTGAITAASGDYTTTLVTEGTNLYFTAARAQGAITGGASTIATSNLIVSRALISNSSGKVAVSAVTSAELGYMAGVTSGIQNQLNGKQASLDSSTSVILSSNTLQRAALSGDVSAAQNNNAVTVTGIRDKSITLGPGYLRYTGSAWEFRNETYLTSETTYTFASGTTNGAFSVTPSGGSAQSVAIYGLDTAAYRKAQTSVTDTTANSLMQVGAFGLGASFSLIKNYAEWDDISLPTAIYRSTSASDSIFNIAGVGLNLSYASTYSAQLHIGIVGTTLSVKARATVASSTWGNVQELYHTGNLVNPVTGTGAAGCLPKFTGASALDNSVIYETDGNILIGTTTNKGAKLQISNNVITSETPSLGSGNYYTTLFNWSSNTFGLGIHNNSSGRTYIQNQRYDGNTATYDICLQPLGGNLAIGKTSVTSGYRLDVNGAINASGKLTGYDIDIKAASSGGSRQIIFDRGLAGGYDQGTSIRNWRINVDDTAVFKIQSYLNGVETDAATWATNGSLTLPNALSVAGTITNEYIRTIVNTTPLTIANGASSAYGWIKFGGVSSANPDWTMGRINSNTLFRWNVNNTTIANFYQNINANNTDAPTISSFAVGIGNSTRVVNGDISGYNISIGTNTVIDSSRNATFSKLVLYQTGSSSGLEFNNYGATINNSVNPLNSIYIGDDTVEIRSNYGIALAGNVGISGTTTLATSLTGLLKASGGLVSAATAGSDYTKPLAKVYTMSVFSDSAISDAFTYTIPANTLNYNGSAIKCEFVVEQMMGTPSSSIVQLNFDGNTTTYTPNTGDWGPAGMHFTFTIMRTSSSEVRISRLAKGVFNISGWWDDSSAYATVAFSSIDFTSAITLKLSGKSGNVNIGTYLAMGTLTLT